MTHATATTATSQPTSPVAPIDRAAAHAGPLIVGLAGAAGAGKDAAAEHLICHYGFVRYAFAEPLRDMLEALLVGAGLDYAYVHERQLKELPIPGLGLSYRHLVQTLGTEWGRLTLHPDIWLLLAGLRLGLPDAPVHDRICITDVRFGNEADWVRARRGVLLQIARPGVAPVRPHVSEAAAADPALLRPHAQIDNGGSLAQLHAQLDAQMQRLGVAPRSEEPLADWALN